jgi:hypothetical protein
LDFFGFVTRVNTEYTVGKNVCHVLAQNLTVVESFVEIFKILFEHDKVEG